MQVYDYVEGGPFELDAPEIERAKKRCSICGAQPIKRRNAWWRRILRATIKWIFPKLNTAFGFECGRRIGVVWTSIQTNDAAREEIGAEGWHVITVKLCSSELI